MYKTLYSLILIFSISNISFTSNLDEIVSVYTPPRLGLPNTVNISLENVQDGPEDQNFSLKYINNEECRKIEKGSMNFDNGRWYYDNGQRTVFHLEPTQNLIKDRISTYGIARLTFDSYKDCINFFPLFNQQEKLNSSNRLSKLKVSLDPNDRICIINKRLAEKNAYYQRKEGVGGQGEIKLCNLKYRMAKFFDVVAHETGHSILDALQPSYNSSIQYAALHESFGDLSAVFASVRLLRLKGQEYLLSRLIDSFSSNLCIAEGWDGPQSCLRNAPQYREQSCEAHKLSNHFTSFYIQTIREVFQNLGNTSQNALWVFDFFQHLLIKAVINNRNFLNFYDFSEKMIQQIPNQGLSLLETLGLKFVRNTLFTQLDSSKEDLQKCSPSSN